MQIDWTEKTPRKIQRYPDADFPSENPDLEDVLTRPLKHPPGIAFVVQYNGLMRRLCPAPLTSQSLKLHFVVLILLHGQLG